MSFVGSIFPKLLMLPWKADIVFTCAFAITWDTRYCWWWSIEVCSCCCWFGNGKEEFSTGKDMLGLLWPIPWKRNKINYRLKLIANKTRQYMPLLLSHLQTKAILSIASDWPLFPTLARTNIVKQDSRLSKINSTSFDPKIPNYQSGPSVHEKHPSTHNA